MAYLVLALREEVEGGVFRVSINEGVSVTAILIIDRCLLNLQSPVRTSPSCRLPQLLMTQFVFSHSIQVSSSFACLQQLNFSTIFFSFDHQIFLPPFNFTLSYDDSVHYFFIPYFVKLFFLFINLIISVFMFIYTHYAM